MRRFLDVIYDSAAILAALFLFALLGIVLLTIASREFQWGLTGIDGYAGYLMAACGFLSLAHTFKRDEHIRVTLFLGLTKGLLRYLVELWALAASTLLAFLLAFFSVRLGMHLHGCDTSLDTAANDGHWNTNLSACNGG